MSRCYICGEENPNALQTHHILPRRHGGKDMQENTVTLCANCHMAIEAIYDDSFYSRIKNRLSEWKIEDATLEAAIEEFCNDELEIYDNTISVASKAELYESYLCYCRERDYPVHTSQTRFCEHLKRTMDVEISLII
jgi:phage/plasmid-associated DNA primase